MPKNTWTKREELICGKLDELTDMLEGVIDSDIFDLIEDIRRDATRMENKLISRKAEVEALEGKK